MNIELLDNTVLNRKYLIYVFVIGNLIRGYIYHFFPFIDVIYKYLFVIWPLVIIFSDLIRRKIVFDKYQTVLWLFLGIAILSVIAGRKPATFTVWESLIYFIMHAYIFFTASRFYEKEEIQAMIVRIAQISFWVITVVAICSCIFYVLFKAGIMLPFGLNSHDRLFTYGHYGNEDRFCGLFGYSTNGGNYCMTAAVLGIFLAEQKKLPVWGSVLGFILHFITIYLLDVRTDILILLVVLVVLLYRLLRKRLSTVKSILVIICLFALLVTGFIILKQDAVAELMRRVEENPYQASIDFSTGRTEFWVEILHQLYQRPLLGWGWLNSDIIGYFDAHNLFINLFMWTGILGFGVFFVFLIMLCIEVFKNRKHISKMYNSTLIILMICAFLDSMLDRGIAGTYYNLCTSLFWICGGFFVYLNSRKVIES